MTTQMPIPLDQVFVPAGTPTFQDLINALSAQGSLFPTRERDLISGLRRVAQALGLPPSDVPCDARWLQPRLDKISPAQLGISKKTWQNSVSNARAAMATAGIVERRFRRTTDLAPAWRSLWRRLLELDDATLSTSLGRFVHFLSRQRIIPDEVNEQHASAFLEAVTLNEISKDPETSYRAAVNGWNLAVARVPGWPQTPIPRPSRQKIFRLPDQSFPATFLTDLDSLIAAIGANDPLSETGRHRALRPATLKQYRSMLLRFASELVHAGIDASTITSVSSLLEPTAAERGLRQMLSRNGNTSSRGIAEVARLLPNIATTLHRPSEEVARLRQLSGKLAMDPQKGLTAKNRERLRVLQQPRNRMDLLTLPERIFRRGAGNKKPYSAALDRETALAIAILLVCPIRVKNLAELELGHHLQRPGDGRVYLALEEEDTKTSRPIEFELPEDVVRLIDEHLASRVPWMCPAGTPYLFPKRSGEAPVNSADLATRISKLVCRELGLEINAHLFRHFAVMNWLDANPGGYEVARRLLGHADVSHTINMYSGMEVKTATRAFSDLIGALREGKE
ncbi:site-specific integrase [Salipiger bermudensis]|uniref:tyrosine-type recombinase/integrase n=1 Tax=Salipiger bermudensis TaxID=344736 RepID=UPI001C997EEF|nr:tyrosine-type recombinase/integrase [Salipiger bermudensis]MBY6006708.1 site-specific integrase [Salipiger bermudensis]